jgi:regulator of ribonuclease activity A
MSNTASTSDLYDKHGEDIASCDTQFRQFGGRTRFQGTIVTLRSHEDNAILKALITEPGQGKVAVVDGGGSTHCAMLGDNMALTALTNGWEGLIIHGAVRDATALVSLDIGIKAIGTNPRRSFKHGTGTRDIPVSFGGAVFIPGAHVVSDEDGIVVLT